MRGRHPEAARSVAFKIEFDHDGRLVAHHPSIVPRLNSYNLRRGELQQAAVGVLNMDLAARQEADMRVPAEIGSGHRLHVNGPTEPRRVDSPLDTS